MTVRTGVCAQKESFQVKNHTWPFTVDPDCGAFEELKIRGVPLAEGLFADLAVLCKGVEACSLTSTFEHTGTLGLDGVRTSASGTFDRLSFSEGSVRLESDRLALNLTLDDRPEVSLITASAGFNLNPDGHPARLNLFASGVPGEGLTSLTANLSVDRPGARFSTFVFFTDDGGAVEFSQLTLTVTVAAGAVNLELKSSVAPTGLIGGGVGATIAF